jgi:hypothetical protein
MTFNSNLIEASANRKNELCLLNVNELLIMNLLLISENIFNKVSQINIFLG